LIPVNHGYKIDYTLHNEEINNIYLLEHSMSLETNPDGPNFSLNNGLLPAIAQDADTGKVLMMAWMNIEAYQETIRTGQAVYFSRSRNKLWYKGEESGHIQTVEQLLVDCDRDTILMKVRQNGAACHEGYLSCFFQEVTENGFNTVEQRIVNPEDVYNK
tara:strand:+ start:320 stop:796 length:477 start_codon:yes stop_codon:yes gene_type:complete